MTDRLSEIRERLERATPWPVGVSARSAIGGYCGDLLESAPADIAYLLSRITELEDEAKHRPAWECAKHRTFGPSYLSCAHCAAADPEKKEGA